jgi:hypothetical protein
MMEKIEKKIWFETMRVAAYALLRHHLGRNGSMPGVDDERCDHGQANDGRDDARLCDLGQSVDDSARGSGRHTATACDLNCRICDQM